MTHLIALDWLLLVPKWQQWIKVGQIYTYIFRAK